MQVENNKKFSQASSQTSFNADQGFKTTAKSGGYFYEDNIYFSTTYPSFPAVNQTCFIYYIQSIPGMGSGGSMTIDIPCNKATQNTAFVSIRDNVSAVLSNVRIYLVSGVAGDHISITVVNSGSAGTGTFNLSFQVYIPQEN